MSEVKYLNTKHWEPYEASLDARLQGNEKITVEAVIFGPSSGDATGKHLEEVLWCITRPPRPSYRSCMRMLTAAEVIGTAQCVDRTATATGFVTSKLVHSPEASLS